MIPEIEIYKEIIPEFVIKLYHILEKNEFRDYITWANDGTEILIKNPKRLQDKVLPYFFRHKHLSSFIRQLNMYKFNKVNKISKERSHMYFKNEHFRQGQIEEMKLIKRNQRPKKNDPANVSLDGDSNINKEQSVGTELNVFKEQSQAKFSQVQEILNGILKKYPALKKQLTPAIDICQSVTGEQITFDFQGLPSMNNLLPDVGNEENENKNMLGMGNTVRDFPLMHSVILPSLCSLTHFDA